MPGLNQDKLNPLTDLSHRWLTLNRIAALTDGIFAIVMTLLVLTLDLPEKVELLNQAEIKVFLNTQWHVLYIYMLSFLILAKFWTAHHSQFSHLRATNPTHLWLNIIFLMFSALLPFTADLAGELPNYWLSQFPFHLNMFLISITYLMCWQYATADRRLLKDDTSENLVRYISLKTWVTPFVAILCMLTAFIVPAYSSVPYLLIPIIHKFIRFRFKNKL
ncbi:MAG: TMEM175 family protein [Candidatus Celaenobacter antarcticus]|nr:TMEM175 family protein [Candidatus Celaenobacter antarcticus]